MKPKSQAADDIHNFEDLVEVMRRLRDPDGGCPWDLEQNFKTIIPYTIEEAYEVADAVDRENMRDLREELGDLLLQSIYHAQMASELGHFTIQDVVNDVTAKMISRHPHVFGDGEAQSAEDVNKIWDQKKDQEKNNESVLDGVAAALPALLWSQKLQKRAGKVGFEWKNPEDILNKLEEELGELREAHETGTLAHQAEELGDVLFVSNLFKSIKAFEFVSTNSTLFFENKAAFAVETNVIEGTKTLSFLDKFNDL